MNSKKSIFFGGRPYEIVEEDGEEVIYVEGEKYRASQDGIFYIDDQKYEIVLGELLNITNAVVTPSKFKTKEEEEAFTDEIVAFFDALEKKKLEELKALQRPVDSYKGLIN